ncbi:hypothetical protein M885DRAFT_481216 [Pelagophyceae sp. CCMP2097]|nr:hypothetical protein M885DRAFT_481216 [Pelagophyceae sp. CCMP2097]
MSLQRGLGRGAVVAAVASAAVALWRRRRARRVLKLTYLDIPGVAECIRLALWVGGVDFIDERVSYAEVAALRASGALPFGQVPIITVDGNTFGQSKALLRWAGNVTGLDAPRLRLRIDSIEEGLGDIIGALKPQWYGNALARSPVSGELIEATKLTEKQKASVQQVLNEEVLPARYAQLERMVHGPFFCGAQLTTVDLSFYVMATGLADGTYCAGVSKKLLDECPKLKRLVAAVQNHPRVQSWAAHRKALESVATVQF